VTPSPSAPCFAEGTVLARMPARDRSWARRLPRVPEGRVLTVTVGDPGLMPVPLDDLVANGYRVVGDSADLRAGGDRIDVLVPPDLRDAHPGWWYELASAADRVFDLTLGPVLEVLADELELHRSRC